QLIAMAEQYGLDVTALKERQAAAEDEINNRQREKERQIQEDRINEWKTIAVDAANEIATTVVNINRNRNQAEYDERIQNLEKQRERELANQDLTNAQRK